VNRGLYYLIFVCILLAGCSGGSNDVKQFVANVKEQKPGEISPLPANKEYEAAEYTAQSYRSPFVPGSGRSVQSVATSTEDIQGSVLTDVPRPDAARPREYLERYPLSNFIMVGTLSKHSQYWGLVQDVNGKVHAVKVGDYIGENSGHIIKITETSIELDEIVADGAGGWAHKNTVMTLRSTNVELPSE
jgi:type IV pilus assembly protein PilP